jgi:hypothetical protein
MPMKNENRMSEKGEAKGHGKRPAETVKSIEGEKGGYCGSSTGDGVRFPIPNHPDKSVMTPGGK